MLWVPDSKQHQAKIFMTSNIITVRYFTLASRVIVGIG